MIIMSFKEFWKKEKYVAVHGQTAGFRIMKYIIMLIVGSIIYYNWGLVTLAWAILYAFIFAIAMHFFFRWKTDGWTKSWGLYKKII
jgi:hypothetical protein